MKVALLSETTDAESFLSDSAWLAQEKLDGVRMLVRREGSSVTCYNRRGEVVATPEAVRTVALTGAVDFLFDGEFLNGAFVAFDALEISGDDIYSEPLFVRLASLKAASPFAIARTAMDDEKLELLHVIRVEGGEGVVFKRIDGAYIDGRGESTKFKFYRSDSFTVADTNIAKGTIGLVRNGADCGRVCFPFNGRMPKAGEIVEVRFDKRHVSGKLARPILIGVRDDLVASDLQ